MKQPNVGKTLIQSSKLKALAAGAMASSDSPTEPSCYVDEVGLKRKCTVNATAGVPVGRKELLPLLLGIGPLKTSSSALFELLGQHPQILLGNASRVNEMYCCQMELYYFSYRFTDNVKDLGRYFPIESKPKPRWLAEKTPQYSTHPLVPYRVRATLQSSSLALVFTIRDPLDAHVSNFFHSVQFHGLDSMNATLFLAWSNRLLANHNMYNVCINRTLAYYGLVDNPSVQWPGVQSLDEAVFERCKIHYKLGDGLKSFLYSHSMRRWQKALPQVPMICVFHEDFIKDPTREGRRVVEFLGLDGRKLPKKIVEYKGGSIDPEERIRAIEGGNDARTAQKVKERLEVLRGVFKGEMEFARRFCSDLEHNPRN